MENENKPIDLVGCSVCGNLIEEGDLYVERNGTVICAHCTEELDLCDVLDFLELHRVLELFIACGDCVKTVN